MSVDFVYLASASPRRRQLLQQIGVPFQVLGVTVDESLRPGEEPVAYVSRVAAAKAGAGVQVTGAGVQVAGAGVQVAGAGVQVAAGVQATGAPARPVLAADTAVVVGGEILGKPAGREEAVRMLELLSGRTHAVFTAIALAAGGQIRSSVSRSEVTFREIGRAEAGAYWDSGEPRDKAGGYAIQGLGAVFVAQLRGSFSGVMGLPLFETAELLLAAGVPRWCALPADGAR